MEAAIRPRASRGTSRRVGELDVLDPRHRARARGDRLEGVERGSERGVADRVDLRDDPGAGRASRQGGEARRRRHRDAAIVGRALVRLEQQAVRDPSAPSANSFSQPMRARPAGSSRSGKRPCAARVDGRLQGRLADRGMDADGQVRRGRPAPAPPEARARTAVCPQVARIVHADDPEREQRREAYARIGSSTSRRARGAGRATRATADLLENPVGPPRCVATDRAAARVGRSPARSRPDRGHGPADPDRVVVVRPERHEPARGRRVQVVGRRPAPPAPRVPAAALDPRRRSSPSCPRDHG